MSLIRPITGGFQRKVKRDILTALSLGMICSTLYWEFDHKPTMEKYRQFAAENKMEIERQDALWMKENNYSKT